MSHKRVVCQKLTFNFLAEYATPWAWLPLYTLVDVPQPLDMILKG